MELYCENCGYDIRASGFDACPNCEPEPKLCECGKESNTECTICGDFLCKECVQIIGRCIDEKRDVVDMCKDCWKKYGDEND